MIESIFVNTFYGPLRGGIFNPITKSGPPKPYLFYTKSPNYNIETDTVIDDGDVLPDDWTWLRYRAPVDDAAVFAAAPMLYNGSAADPLELSVAELEALSGINTFNVWFSESKGLAVYDNAVIDATVVLRIARYFRETVPSFVGGIPAANLLSYNANIFDATALKFLDSIGISERTLYPLQYIQADGTGYFLNSDMVTAGRTITSTTKNGTTTLSSPSAGRLNATSGTLWDFTVTWSDAVVSSYAYCSLVTSTYAICFDRSGNGRHLVATGFSSLATVCVSGREFGSDVLNLYGWSAGGLGPELIVNGDFSNGSNGWIVGADWSVVDGVMTASGATGSTVSQSRPSTIITGKTYKLEFDHIQTSGSTAAYMLGNTLWTGGSHSGHYSNTLTAGSTGFFNITANTSFSGTIDNASIKASYPSTVPIPARTDNPTLDALGNALTYPGRAKYSIVPKGRTGNCATLASGTSIAITGVTGATVLSKEGTGTVTIGTNVINRATDGTLYNLKLTLSTGRVLTLPLTEGAGTTVWGYDNTGQTYTGTITAADINAFWAGKQTTFFHGLQYGESYTETEVLTTQQQNCDGGWTAGGLSTVSGGKARIYSVDSTNTYIVIFGVLVVGRRYKLTLTIDTITTPGGGIAVESNYADNIPSTVGTHTVYFTATGGTYLTIKRASSAVDFTIDNISVKLLSRTPANPYTTGLDCLGNALTNPPLKFNASSLYSLSDSHQARAATGWTYGSANTFYNADGTQKELTFAQLDAAGTGPRYYLGTAGTALYSVDQSATDSLIKSTLQV